MSDTPPSPSENKLSETADTEDKVFPGDDISPLSSPPSSPPSSPGETDDLGEDATGTDEEETSVADESDLGTGDTETKVVEDQSSVSSPASGLPLGNLEEGGTDAEGDTDSDSDDDLYQKLEMGVNSTTLLEKHPGVTQSSYAEILTLTKVVRNDKGEIIDELHRTYPFVSKYERAKIIGVRTKQLNNGADPLVEVPPDIIDGYNIALMEFEAKKLPFIISRPLPNGASEYWRLADLEMVHY